MGRGHKRGGLLVPREDQLDFGSAQRLHQIEVFLARHTEDAVDALVLQCGDKKV